MNLDEVNISRNFVTFDNVETCMQSIGNVNNNMNIVCLNLRSIRKQWDLLITHIHDHLQHIHILILLEINIKQDEVVNYSLPNYGSIALCRTTGRGGGILLLYKNNIQIEQLFPHFLTAELMTVKIKLRTINVLLLIFYRPPSSNVNNFNIELESLLNSNLIKNEKNIVMAGDFNICYLSETYGSMDYVNVLHTYGFHYTIMQPTRVELMNNNLVTSCIDHINIKLKQTKYTTFTIEVKIADHYIIGITLLDEHNERNKNVETKTIQRISNKLVDQAIERTNWWPILDMRDPTEIYNEIHTTFDTIYRNSVVTINERTNSSHPTSPWINNTIKSKIKEKNILWSQLKRNRHDINLKTKFKKIRNELNNIIRRTKRKFYFNLFNRYIRDVRRSWSVVNSFLNKKQRKSVAETITENFKIINREQMQHICEKFKNTFSNIPVTSPHLQSDKFDLTDDMEPSLYKNGNNVSLNIKKVDEDLLLLIISKLNRNSSPGPDKIRPIDIIKNYKFLKLILIHLINRSMDTGEIPQALKMTYIRPIFKKGEKNDTANYRPIGSISVIIKILEHYVNYHINNFCSTYGIINRSQYGFIHGKSTTDLLNKLTNDINIALDSRRYVIAVSLDLTKAFDMVKYKILIEKLIQIGIGGKLLRWIQNYFTNRKMQVNLDEMCSSSIEQSCGLIQGSVLAPTLFNIYVNDLAYLKFKGNILQYADDTIIYSEHKEYQQALLNSQQNLNLAVKYFHNNEIKINPNKTQVIVFKSNRMASTTQQNITCHNHTCLKSGNSNCQCSSMSFVNSIKHLGVYLDSNMKYNSHITHLCKILRITLYSFYKISHCFPIHIKRIIYFSLVESLIRYGLASYATAPEYIMKPLRTILDRIHKVLFHDIHPKTLGIMKLDDLKTYLTLEKFYFETNFRKQRETQYARRTDLYVVPRYKNEYGKNTFEYRIPTSLNSLPSELRHIQSLGLVKFKLKTYLLNER
jgi:hypothetical protein